MHVKPGGNQQEVIVAPKSGCPRGDFLELSAKPGRDHNPNAFTTWLAGGGAKGGTSCGSTDEVGFRAEENRVTVHDLHATILHLLGMNHERLTFRFNGRDFRLTDISGTVIRDIVA